eukprot:1609443-Pyramimonas_sp.AAC.1
MHTKNLGVDMRFTSATLWRLIEANPWRSASKELAAKRLESELFLWFQESGVPHEKRIGTLNLKMIGANCKIKRLPGSCHPGCPMSTKAAETTTLLEFAVH